jgi:citrate/tricarballylate utilization protein
VNVSKTFAELSVETYQHFTWPGFLGGIYRKGGYGVLLITVASVVLIVLLTLLLKGPSGMFSTYLGEGAFYKVVPYELIVLLGLAVSVYVFAALLIGIIRYWRSTGGRLNELLNSHALVQAIWDAMRLRYLEGGGHGCNYPNERFSHSRRWLHHLVFYGFALCIASTTVAAFYEHVLGLAAPYRFWSCPVLLGSVGGVAILIGLVGMIWLKWQSDRAPADQRMLTMGLGFLTLLFFTTFTGFLLLSLRETAAMGILLTIHLGAVLALFLTLPYGKFVHAIYRYASLVRYAIEKSRHSL